MLFLAKAQQPLNLCMTFSPSLKRLFNAEDTTIVISRGFVYTMRFRYCCDSPVVCVPARVLRLLQKHVLIAFPAIIGKQTFPKSKQV